MSHAQRSFVRRLRDTLCTSAGARRNRRTGSSRGALLLRGVAIGVPAGLLFVAPAGAACIVPPWIAPSSWSFGGDVFAIGPGGEIALGKNNPGGYAPIEIFSSPLEAVAQTSPIGGVWRPDFKSWGDLTFKDANTLLFSENGDQGTVYEYYIPSNVLGPLAPEGSVPNAAHIAVHEGEVYVVAANAPGQGAVYKVVNGAATPVLSNIGTGTLGGIAFDCTGNMFVTDSNDPEMRGNAGKVLRFAPDLTSLPSIDLTGGGGSGADDISLCSDGNIWVTTGPTVTHVQASTLIAEPLASFGPEVFLNGIDFLGCSLGQFRSAQTMFVNAGGSGTISLTELPEPGALATLSLVILSASILRRARARRA